MEESRFSPTSVEVPGPVWHHDVSHGLDYDHDAFLIKVVAIIKDHRIVCAIRPMVGSEIIHSKLQGHSREEVLKAYGVNEEENRRLLAQAKQRNRWWRFTW